MIHYRYIQTDLVTWQKNFAKLLGVTNKNYCFKLPEEAGDGFVYASTLHPEMTLLYVNSIFFDDILFDRLPSTDAGLMLYFNEVDIVGEYKLRSGEQLVTDRSEKRNSVFVGSTKFPLQISMNAQSRLRVVAIRFSEKLVRGFINSDNFSYLRDYTNDNLKNANDDEFTPDIRRLLEEIYKTDITTIIGRLILTNRALLLIEKYLQNFLNRKVLGPKKIKTRKDDLERLRQVEKALTKELASFPSIENLSKMAMMSTTKLKNQFKQVYGMKLYEFYNHNRLLNARALLESGDSSVKEAALQIGFANLSNFSKAFKKEFGKLPKEVIP